MTTHISLACPAHNTAKQESIKPLVLQENLRVWLTKIQQSDPFNSPCPGEEFAALIVVYDSQVSHDNRSAITDALIKQGCRYGVCLGYDCSGWDDSLDWSYIFSDPDFSPPNDRFVMSTWHEDEPLEDTIFHFLKCTKFDAFSPRNFVVAIIGEGPHEEIIKLVRLELAAVYDN